MTKKPSVKPDTSKTATETSNPTERYGHVLVWCFRNLLVDTESSGLLSMECIYVPICRRLPPPPLPVFVFVRCFELTGIVHESSKLFLFLGDTTAGWWRRSSEQRTGKNTEVFFKRINVSYYVL